MSKMHQAPHFGHNFAKNMGYETVDHFGAYLSGLSFFFYPDDSDHSKGWRQ